MALELDPEVRKAHDATRPPEALGISCHAPFTNLYFDQLGRVLACCLNTTHVLGTYPDDRVIDIWDGDTANELRRAMAASDFGEGCQDCHSSLSDWNFSGMHRNFDINPVQVGREVSSLAVPATPQLPSTLEFSLSNRCNLECQMCNEGLSSSIRKRKGMAPLPMLYGSGFIDEIEPFLAAAKGVKFYGGEPFVEPLNYEIFDRILQVNPSCNVVVTTNATVLNDRVRSFVTAFRPAIVCSIDAFTAETYESIRVNADHRRVVANFHEFVRLLGDRVSLAVCPMPQNWHELVDLVRMANSCGVYIGFNVVVEPAAHSLHSLPRSELGRIVAALRSADFPTTTETERGNRMRFQHLVNQLAAWVERPVPETPVALNGNKKARFWMEVLEIAGEAPGRSQEPQSHWFPATDRDLLDGWLESTAGRSIRELAGVAADALVRWRPESVTTPDREERLDANLQTFVEGLTRAASLDMSPLERMLGYDPTLIAAGLQTMEQDEVARLVDLQFCC